MLVRQTLKKNTVDPTQIGSIDGKRKRQLTFVIPLYIDIPNERLAKDNGCTNVIFFYLLKFLTHTKIDFLKQAQAPCAS